MPPHNPELFRQLTKSTSIYWLGLFVALVVLAVIVHYFRAWYRDSDDPADAADENLRQLEEMNRRGDLSDEEYRSIKSQLSGRNVR